MLDGIVEDNVAKRAALKEEWLKLSRVLANTRNRRGKLMPGWVTLQLKQIYTRSSLNSGNGAS